MCPGFDQSDFKTRSSRPPGAQLPSPLDPPTTCQNHNRGCVAIAPLCAAAPTGPSTATPAPVYRTVAMGTGDGQGLDKTFRHERFVSRAGKQLGHEASGTGAGQGTYSTFGHAYSQERGPLPGACAGHTSCEPVPTVEQVLYSSGTAPSAESTYRCANTSSSSAGTCKQLLHRAWTAPSGTRESVAPAGRSRGAGAHSSVNGNHAR
jgi:hypothetical protein